MTNRKEIDSTSTRNNEPIKFYVRINQKEKQASLSSLKKSLSKQQPKTTHLSNGKNERSAGKSNSLSNRFGQLVREHNQAQVNAMKQTNLLGLELIDKSEEASMTTDQVVLNKSNATNNGLGVADEQHVDKEIVEKNEITYDFDSINMMSLESSSVNVPGVVTLSSSSSFFNRTWLQQHMDDTFKLNRCSRYGYLGQMINKKMKQVEILDQLLTRNASMSDSFATSIKCIEKNFFSPSRLYLLRQRDKANKLNKKATVANNETSWAPTTNSTFAETRSNTTPIQPSTPTLDNNPVTSSLDVTINLNDDALESLACTKMRIDTSNSSLNLLDLNGMVPDFIETQLDSLRQDESITAFLDSLTPISEKSKPSTSSQDETKKLDQPMNQQPPPKLTPIPSSPSSSCSISPLSSTSLTSPIISNDTANFDTISTMTQNDSDPANISNTIKV